MAYSQATAEFKNWKIENSSCLFWLLAANLQSVGNTQIVRRAHTKNMERTHKMH